MWERTYKQMVMIKKKKKDASVGELIQALSRFILCLERQNESEAAADLMAAKVELGAHPVGSDQFTTALNAILEAFDGDHELRSYMFARQKKSTEWTESDELFLESSTVFNLVQRLLKG